MTPSFLRVMLWKEFRELAPFWIVLAAVGLGVQAIWISNLWVEWVEAPSAMNLLQTAIVFAGLFLVGCGGAQFAAERENGTYTFLRALPTGPTPLFFVKITAALVGNLLMLGLLVGAMTLTPHFPEQLDPEQKWLAAALVLQGIVLGVFFWIVFFSLISRRAFGAILLGLLVGLSVPWWNAAAAFGDHPHIFIGVQVGLFTAVAFLLDACLAEWWFCEKGSWRRTFSIPKDVLDSEAAPAAVWSLPRSVSLFFRLVRQQGRESARERLLTALVMAAGTAVLVCTTCLGSHGPEIGRTVLLLGALILPPRLGAIVFRTDQRDCRFRFLAEHGLSPQLLWTTRQITGILSTIPFIVAGAGLAMFVYWNDMRVILRDLPGIWEESQAIETLALIGAGMLSAYAAGQFCSMTIRSPLVAGFSAVGLAVLGYSAAAFLDFFHVNGFLLAAAWTLSLFAATYLAADAWITERQSWKTGARTGVVLAVPLMTVLVGTALYRAFELPVVAIDIRPEQLVPEVTQEERANAGRIEAVLAGLTVPGERGIQQAWLDENRGFFRESLEDLLAVTGPATRPWLEPEGMYFTEESRTAATLNQRKLEGLISLLASEAGCLKRQGDCDKALECLFMQFRLMQYASRSSARIVNIGRCSMWRHVRRLALASEWTPWRLLEIRDELEAIEEVRLSAAAQARWDYLTAVWELEHLPLSGDLGRIAESLPWESERRRRGLRIVAAEKFRRADKRDLVSYRGARYYSVDLAQPPENEYPEFFSSVSLDDPVKKTAREMHSQGMERRATSMALTLLAWKRKHGEYPASIREVKGTLKRSEDADNALERREWRKHDWNLGFDADGLEEDVFFKMRWSPRRSEQDAVAWMIPAKTPLIRGCDYVVRDMAYSLQLIPVNGGKYPEPEEYDSMAQRRMSRYGERPSFRESLLQQQLHWEGQRSIIIPLGPVEPFPGGEPPTEMPAVTRGVKKAGGNATAPEAPAGNGSSTTAKETSKNERKGMNR